MSSAMPQRQDRVIDAQPLPSTMARIGCCGINQGGDAGAPLGARLPDERLPPTAASPTTRSAGPLTPAVAKGLQTPTAILWPPQEPAAPGEALQRSMFQELLSTLSDEHERELAQLRQECERLRQQALAQKYSLELAPGRGGEWQAVPEIPAEGPSPFSQAQGSQAQPSLQQSMASLQECVATLTKQLKGGGLPPDEAAQGSLFGATPANRSPSKENHKKRNLALPMQNMSPELAKLQGKEVKDRSDMTSKQDMPKVPFGDRVRIVLNHERFEIMILILILSNTLVMAFEMQYQGIGTGYRISFPDTTRPETEIWPGAAGVFSGLNWVFSGLFTMEVLLKLVFLRCSFLKVPLNWIDIFAVLVGNLADVMAEYLGPVGNPMVVRLLRLFKMERGLRVLKVSRILDNLSLLLKCLAASVSTLFWSLCLLIVIQCIAGMILGSLVRDYIEDPTQDEGERHEVYMYYGTFTKAMLTMFEVTLANWGPPCRVLVANINEWFALFFLIYRCTVGFAVLGVISAVFVQQTMTTAARDSEILLNRKRLEQEDYTTLLRALFHQMDASGDGMLSYEEFQDMLKNEAMQSWMGALDISMTVAEGLWHVCADDEGNVSFDMFLDGAMRVKGPAKSFDMVRLMADIKKMQDQIHVLVARGSATRPAASGSPRSWNALVSPRGRILAPAVRASNAPAGEGAASAAVPASSAPGPLRPQAPVTPVPPLLGPMPSAGGAGAAA